MKVSEDIKTIIRYMAGKPICETKREYGLTKVVKLASNENPLGVSPRALETLRLSLENQNRYPDPSYYELIIAASTKWNISRTSIAVGNGSNELIDILIRIYCEPGEAILTSQQAFAAYATCAQTARVKRVFSKLKTGYQTDLTDMDQILKNDKNNNIKLIFIPNPNNPTGTHVSDTEIQEFLKIYGHDPNRLIVFDEAYNEYCRAHDYKSALGYLQCYKSVVVLRTFSKAYGLAGLRVGLLFAQPEVVEYLNRVRNPFNVSDLAQVAAIAALQDDEYISRSVQNNNLGLNYFYENLRKMNIPFVESQGNFVMFDTLRDVSKVNAELLRRGLILRPILSYYGFKTQMRMTVGLPEENQFAIKTLEEVFKLLPTIQL